MDTAAQGLLSRDEMESRRLLAAQDLQTGLSQSQIARKFGVSRTTASRWNRTLSGKGVESLRKRRAPGRPSRVSADQLKLLTDTYQVGPRATGFDTAGEERAFFDRWPYGVSAAHSMAPAESKLIVLADGRIVSNDPGSSVLGVVGQTPIAQAWLKHPLLAA